MVSVAAPSNGSGAGGCEDGTSNSDPSLKSSYKALQAWKASVAEDPNGFLTNWVGPNVCSYNRVFCSEPPKAELSTSSGRVVAVIDLNHANIKGTLVDDLSRITYLSALHLNSNRFYGSVPETLADLEYLTELDLSNNMFTGSFPISTLYIPNLVYLDLRFNRFVGEIPDELFDKDLDAIFLHNNMFDGQLPNRLWNSPASVVTLANNRFSGSLPETFGYMGYTSSSGLREVLFLNNKLTGCIPEGVGFLTNMEVLDFSFNSFTGHLPTTISCLAEVEVLNLAHNQIIGVVSDMVCSLRKLVNLTISYNFFSGFSSGCGSKPFLGFDFSGNCINGRESQRPRHQCASLPVPVPGGFLVVMLSKAKTTGTAGSTSAQVPASVPAPTPIATEAPPQAPPPVSSVNDFQRQGSETSDVYGQAASNLVAGSNLEPTVQQLMDMGGGNWDKDTVIRALRAAYNNPERAVDYLYSGIPETAEVPLPVARFPTNTASSPGTNIDDTTAAGTTPVSGIPNSSPLDLFPQGTPNIGSNLGAGTLDFLRENRQFQQLRAMVQANPHILQPMLQELSKQNPQLLRLIQDHHAEFLQLLNEPVEGVEGDMFDQPDQEMPHAVSVTADEQEVIGRLEAMGFERSLVIEAFLACDRNEELAANYLLEHAGEED